MVPLLDLSATYAFDDSEEFAAASRDKVGRGYVYTRWANPTIDAFEAAVADLEGTADAEAFATGMGAITTTILSHCVSGDRIVAARQLYGGTWALFSTVLPRYGIDVTFVDVSDHDGIAAATAGAKLLYCETIGNPRIEVADLPALGEIAATAGVPLVVDNTFATPVLCRPAEFGARMVLHSATKSIGGHNDLMGGIVCGDAASLAPVKALGRDFGATLAPFNAWLCLRGLATMPLRVERSAATAHAVAEALTRHEAVASVSYPALENDPARVLCDKLLGGRGGGTLGFEVRGGRTRTSRFQEALRLVRPAASLGGTRSLLVHAASVTHTQLDDEQLAAAGISEGWCRLSVGLEDPDDLIADLTSALAAG